MSPAVKATSISRDKVEKTSQRSWRGRFIRKNACLSRRLTSDVRRAHRSGDSATASYGWEMCDSVGSLRLSEEQFYFPLAA